MDKAATLKARLQKKIKFHLAYIAIQTLSILPGGTMLNAAQFGQSVEFSLWIKRHFGMKSRFFPTREALWHCILSEIPQKTSLCCYEFGVAYGYITKWWLKRCPAIDSWYGFDTFTGLPQEWRHFPKGAFDAEGKPPLIHDSRVKWIIGRVEERFTPDAFIQFERERTNDTQNIFFFDLDLYQPTRHALDIILPQLKKGDVLYFDEAADLDERRVLLESLDTLKKTTVLIGSTPMAMALRK